MKKPSAQENEELEKTKTNIWNDNFKQGKTCKIIVASSVIKIVNDFVEFNAICYFMGSFFPSTPYRHSEQLMSVRLFYLFLSVKSQRGVCFPI